MSESDSSLKLKTARTIKWNAIDKFSSQIMYAAVGVVLANILTPGDFGLVGALLAFQAFAIIFVDSGFAAALLRLKDPTDRDYSTVFWFNLVVAIIIYIILFLSAPLIADIFQGDQRLIPLSKVMFLTFILNGLAIVQTNRMMKKMDVKQIAISNLVAQISSGIVGIWLAVTGFGPWALVWQYVSLAAVKTGWLWAVGNWFPSSWFCLDSFRRIWRVGLSVFSSSALNVLCQNIYSFVIGGYYSLASLGLYTQADKWSKMGSASISQIFTSSFVPVLSGAQDDPDRFKRYVKKINRFAAFILFPVMFGIVGISSPLFHTLFGNKWDGAIILFQILTLRGILITLMALYNNYLLALGYAKKMFAIEVIKDCMIVVAILATIWWGSVPLLVWGQFAASVVTFAAVLQLTSRSIGYSKRDMIRDLLPSALLASAMLIVEFAIDLSGIIPSSLNVNLRGAFTLLTAITAGAALFLFLAKATRLQELPEAMAYLSGRRKK